MQAMLPDTVVNAPTEEQDVLEDGSVGKFLTSLNNYERLYNAEASIPGALTGSKNQQKKLNPKVRQVMTDEINSMMGKGKDGKTSEPTIGYGNVKGTYQSSWDTGTSFGGEVGLDGVWGDEYVLHGHYYGKGEKDDQGNDVEPGTIKPGSVGLKHGSDPKGMRISNSLDDSLSGDPDELFQNFSSKKTT